MTIGYVLNLSLIHIQMCIRDRDLAGIICDYDKLYAAVESKKALFRAKEGNDLGARIQQDVYKRQGHKKCYS